MRTFLSLPADRRLLAFQQVDATMGLQAFSVEKDFWVCWTLRELFALPGVGEHLTFKGGTSLSKAWTLIERFTLEVDPSMADGQCLLFTYPSVFPPGSAGYVRPVVKIELGARSDDWPHENRDIVPYVTGQFPNLDADTASSIRVLAPERTFWEKACLLHEETFRPADKPRPIRMARHYYDLWCLLKAGVGTRALDDMALFERVAEHREIFFRLTWVDYTTHKPGAFRLTPPTDHLTNWRTDYKAMQGPMFFGDTPSFNELMVAAAGFERRFNGLGMATSS